MCEQGSTGAREEVRMDRSLAPKRRVASSSVAGVVGSVLQAHASRLTMLALAAVLAATAAPATGQEPVVRAVMFYSPTCPHCHEIITTELPAIEEHYAGSFEVHLINTDAPAGGDVFYELLNIYDVPDIDRGVPGVLIGDRLLLGEEIEPNLVAVIEEGLAAGGLDWPTAAGVNQLLPEHGGGTGEAETVADMSIRERLSLDPVGSTVAIVWLVVMVVSVLVASFAWLRGTAPADVGVGWRAWLIPALVLIGLVIAGYLAYVETTATAAVCGPVGDCNRVQQSEYARLFGLLPIGVLGVLGYLVILGLWAWQRFGPRELSARTLWLLPLTGFGGTLFSIYLTFLEPFVIAAICMWCVTSAVLMTLLMLISSGLSPALRPARLAGPEPAAAPRAATAEAGAANPGREAGLERQLAGAAGSAGADERQAEPAQESEEKPTVLRRVAVGASYLVAVVAGALVGAVLVHLYQTFMPPPLVSSVAQENRRVAIENALLIGGLVLTPVAWHAARSWWRERRRA